MKTLTGGKIVNGTLEPFHSRPEFLNHMFVALTPIVINAMFILINDKHFLELMDDFNLNKYF